MKIKYTGILKGCIALILTVACLFAIQAVWQTYAVDSPLDKTLKEIDSVVAVTLEDRKKTNEGTMIYVTLGNVDNLQKTYEEITAKTEQTLKGSKYTLKIQDNRSQELDQAYYNIHYYVQKSMVDGDFPQLEAKIQEKAHRIEATAKLYVDKENIYLQLSKNNQFLYTVVAR
jgi:hypothetical protein